jgi:hypothetical protein
MDNYHDGVYGGSDLDYRPRYGSAGYGADPGTLLARLPLHAPRTIQLTITRAPPEPTLLVVLFVRNPADNNRIPELGTTHSTTTSDARVFVLEWGWRDLAL